MPTVQEYIDDELIEINFEMWCEVCGHGICRNTKYQQSTTNHFTTFCEKCNEERENLIIEQDNLLEKVKELEARLEQCI